MDSQLKQKWVEALRSGEYRQTKYELKSRGCYCCLGVLATVAGADFEKDRNGRWVPVLNGESIFDADGNTYLKDGFAGLSTRLQEKLSKMNDYGKKFAQIADYIETNIPAAYPLSPGHHEGRS